MADNDGARARPPRRLSRTVLRRLRQPLDPALVSERVSDDGETLRYLEGWRVIEQANAIFGHGRWGAEVVGEVAYRAVPTQRAPGAPTPQHLHGDGPRDRRGLPRALRRRRAASSRSTRAEAHATAYKAAVTDALKRALRHWGPRSATSCRGRGRTDAGAHRPTTAPPGPRSRRARRLRRDAHARVGRAALRLPARDARGTAAPARARRARARARPPQRLASAA